MGLYLPLAWAGYSTMADPSLNDVEWWAEVRRNLFGRGIGVFGFGLAAILAGGWAMWDGSRREFP